MVWSVKEGIDWTIPVDIKPIQLEMLDGNIVPYGAGRVRLGEMPVLLRESMSTWDPTDD
jgi:hypothetical protein